MQVGLKEGPVAFKLDPKRFLIGQRRSSGIQIGSKKVSNWSKKVT